MSSKLLSVMAEASKQVITQKEEQVSSFYYLMANTKRNNIKTNAIWRSEDGLRICYLKNMPSISFG